MNKESIKLSSTKVLENIKENISKELTKRKILKCIEDGKQFKCSESELIDLIGTPSDSEYEGSDYDFTLKYNDHKIIIQGCGATNEITEICTTNLEVELYEVLHFNNRGEFRQNNIIEYLKEEGLTLEEAQKLVNKFKDMVEKL